MLSDFLPSIVGRAELAQKEKEREERIRRIKEMQEDERKKKLEELKVHVSRKVVVIRITELFYSFCPLCPFFLYIVQCC